MTFADDIRARLVQLGTPATRPGGASRRGSHRLANIMQCPRKTFFHTIFQLESKYRARYFDEGTLIHLALAYHFADRLEHKPDWYRQKTLEQALEEEGTGAYRAIQLALGVYKAYPKAYPNDSWQPLAIEHELATSVGALRRHVSPSCAPHPMDDQIVSSRLDLIMFINDQVWHADYKSVGATRARNGHLAPLNPNGEYAISWQFTVQTLILRALLGTTYRGMMIERVLRADPPQFERDYMPIATGPYLEAPDTIAVACQRETELVTWVLKQGITRPWERLPEGYFWSCFSWGQECEYRPICKAPHERDRKAIIENDYEHKS